MSPVTAGASDPFMDAFRKGMIELGYVEGQNFLMEPRYGAGKFELMVEQATELERAGVDVIIAGPFDALRAANQSTSRVPIIMTPSADPVVAGIVASLDHPGGNITGITEMMPQLTPERLRLLKQIIPALSRVAIMWRPGTLSEEAFRKMIEETRATGSQLGVEVEIVEAAEAKDFDAAFAAMAKAHVEGCGPEMSGPATLPKVGRSAIAAVDPRLGRNCRNYRPRFDNEEVGCKRLRLTHICLGLHAPFAMQ
jgi:putative ABC transport system substrate-binding protein